MQVSKEPYKLTFPAERAMKMTVDPMRMNCPVRRSSCFFISCAMMRLFFLLTSTVFICSSWFHLCPLLLSRLDLGVEIDR